MLSRRNLLKKAPLAGIVGMLGLTTLAKGTGVNELKKEEISDVAAKPSWKDKIANSSSKTKMVKIQAFDNSDDLFVEYYGSGRLDCFEKVMKQYGDTSAVVSHDTFQGMRVIKVDWQKPFNDCYYFMSKEDFDKC